jgi:DNA polymerase alpha subunit A
MDDVGKEFDDVRKKHKITEFASRTVTRKYAFELAGVPQESKYLKIVYSYKRAFIPSPQSLFFVI